MQSGGENELTSTKGSALVRTPCSSAFLATMRCALALGLKKRFAFDQVLALHDVEIGHADGAADRVAGIGEAVHDRPVLRRGVLQHVPDLVRNHRARDGEVGAGDALGQGHDVGLQLVEPGGEPRAGAAEPGDHLVGDEEYVVLGENGLDLLEIALGRQEDAAGPHDRLGDEGGDGVGALSLDHLLEVADHAVGESDLVLARLGVTIEMRAGRVEDALDRQIERLMW